ncbi:MAG: L,D-transpeptidase [Candidatus Micrarchaeota archaeon]|nr:L,D-transpeptidase [Candidatus Micrarchaeota archaeon]
MQQLLPSRENNNNRNPLQNSANNLLLGQKVFEIAEKEYQQKLNINFSNYAYVLFIDGDNQRAYLLQRDMQGRYRHVKIINSDNNEVEFFKISSALLGFSPIKINGTTPTGFFVASAKRAEGALVNVGNSVGTTKETRSMWSLYLPLYGKEAENKGTNTRSIGLHGSSLFKSVMRQKPESHGCIRFFATNTGVPKSVLSEEAKIEDLVRYLTDERIPVFIYVSNPNGVNKNVRASSSYLPSISTEIVQKANQLLEQEKRNKIVPKPKDKENIPVQNPEFLN